MLTLKQIDDLRREWCLGPNKPYLEDDGSVRVITKNWRTDWQILPPIKEPNDIHFHRKIYEAYKTIPTLCDQATSAALREREADRQTTALRATNLAQATTIAKLTAQVAALEAALLAAGVPLEWKQGTVPTCLVWGLGYPFDDMERTAIRTQTAAGPAMVWCDADPAKPGKSWNYYVGDAVDGYADKDLLSKEGAISRVVAHHIGALADQALTPAS